uniref:Tyrosine-type recombinase/integrase n=1 Tax=Conchiformibius kuhniae TaxID=211502 RepID=A0A8T9MWT9_9NEIS|nr:tyrosine-type recombinase/integrase [Conchiformibius kuhniae]
MPTGAELQALTTFFYRQWRDYPAQCKYPMHLIIWFAVYSGRRVSEIARLRLDDWDRQHGEWLVRDIKHPRGSKGNHHAFLVRDDVRTVVDVMMSDAVRGRLKRRGLGAAYLIGGNSASIGTAFQAACKVLGIEDLRFHDLRHEASTRLAEDGLTIPQIQQITLHESWETLRRYVNLRRRYRSVWILPMRCGWHRAASFRLPEMGKCYKQSIC